MPKLSALDSQGSFAQNNIPLARYTTWGVGGIAETFFIPNNKNELSAAVMWARENAQDFFTLGGGSNILISDGMIKTPVILTKAISGISARISGDDVFLDCMAGTQLKSVLSLSARNGWSGLEFAAGIPGTVGGAIAGNAGALSGYVGQAVLRIVTIEADGSTVEWNGREIDWEYRRCPLFDDDRRIACKVTFALRVSGKNDVAGAIKSAMNGRKSQPVSSRTAGCVFKNPPRDSAGRLLDASGCKGMTLGGARVSEVHANFIENFGNCTALDILSLAASCRKRVKERFDTTLDFEIKMLGIPEGAADAQD